MTEPTEPTEEDRAFTRALLGRPTTDDLEPADEPDPARGNHVPREGNNPTAADNSDRTFIAGLFTSGY